MAFPQTVRDLMLEPLSDLNVGPHYTRSSAIHPIRYVGDLGLWAKFKSDVSQTLNTTQWSQLPILPLLSNNQLMSEHNHCGDEHSVQARIYSRVGNSLSLVAQYQGLDVSFGDFKCVPTAYTKIPDFIFWRPSSSVTLVAGEVKAPWIRQHDLA